MAINKVNYNGRTLIDLTEDTVTSETLLSGQTAHDRSGQAITGSLSLDPIQSGLAIIVNGDTASMAVPVGGYAYVKNNTHGLTEGLYTNTSSSAFPASGGTADSTVFTTADGGGLNALNASLIPEAKQFVSTTQDFNWGNIIKMGKVVSIFMRGKGDSNGINLATLPADCVPATSYYTNNKSGSITFPAFNYTGDFCASLTINQNSNIVNGYDYYQTEIITGFLMYLTD